MREDIHMCEIVGTDVNIGVAHMRIFPSLGGSHMWILQVSYVRKGQVFRKTTSESKDIQTWFCLVLVDTACLQCCTFHHPVLQLFTSKREQGVAWSQVPEVVGEGGEGFMSPPEISCTRNPLLPHQVILSGLDISPRWSSEVHPDSLSVGRAPWCPQSCPAQWRRPGYTRWSVPWAHLDLQTVKWSGPQMVLGWNPLAASGQCHP